MLLEVTEAGQQVGLALVQAALGGGAETTAHFHALEVATQDDVDDAGDGVRAVHRRGAILQHFDALDRADRQRIEVDEGVLGVERKTEVGHAVAVDQYQRVLR
ncbi:hypothetical protein D3C81_885530 [compost metagenome]